MLIFLCAESVLLLAHVLRVSLDRTLATTVKPVFGFLQDGLCQYHGT